MMKPRIYKGTRDFLPQQMVKRNYVINTIQTVFKKYGFEPLETPTLELWDTLAGKFGEEADRLTYRFTDRGDREVGLRYDLTVPLSRVIAQYPQIPKPFKRYQIQPVWRAEKPQKGRFREFYQCDIDVIGSASMLAEAEILASIYEVLQSLGFKDFVIRINSRKILRGIAETSGIGLDKETQLTRAIDKLDKIGHEAVINELISHHIDKKIAHTIIKSLSLKGSNQQRLKKTRELLRQSEGGLAGIQEVEDLTEFLKMYNIPDTYISFDLTLARGLDYYTGPIFEIEVKEPKIGSISGGGRYDKLIGLFSSQDQFATGCSIGLERIIAVMEELDMFPNTLRTGGQVLVTIFDKSCIPHAIKLVNTLRKAGIETDLYTGKAKLRGQIGLANDKNIPIVLIMGPDEINKGQVNIKNMLSGEQKLVALAQLVKKIKAELTSVK